MLAFAESFDAMKNAVGDFDRVVIPESSPVFAMKVQSCRITLSSCQKRREGQKSRLLPRYFCFLKQAFAIAKPLKTAVSKMEIMSVIERMLHFVMLILNFSHCFFLSATGMCSLELTSSQR